MIGTIDKSKYSVDVINGVRVITAKFWDECEHRLGTYMEDTDYDFVVQEDTDFYAPPECDLEIMKTCDQNCNQCSSEKNVIFKLRKNVFTQEEQDGAYHGLIDAARPTQNRGLAAGPRGESQLSRDWVTSEQMEIMEYLINRPATLYDDEEDAILRIRKKYASKNDSGENLRNSKKETEVSRGMVWLRTKIDDAGYDYHSFFETKLMEWREMEVPAAAADAKLIRDTFISDTTYANQVNSGLAGFFDRYPRIPYGRETSYTAHNYEKYELCFPFMRKLASEFKKMMPQRHAFQEACANRIDERFRVAGKDTPFTTITVNKNFRTAAHRDAGDLHEGFSNLTVVAKDKNWTGGYLVLPEFRVAVDIRPGDVLLINNHGGIHGNTELLPPEGKTLDDMERVSLVCYFREKMLELGSYEYERMRYFFVEERRTNQDHPDQRRFWNGVSPGMWESQEWYDFLRTKSKEIVGVDGEELLKEYHPKAYNIPTTLEDFF